MNPPNPNATHNKLRTKVQACLDFEKSANLEGKFGLDGAVGDRVRVTAMYSVKRIHDIDSCGGVPKPRFLDVPQSNDNIFAAKTHIPNVPESNGEIFVTICFKDIATYEAQQEGVRWWNGSTGYKLETAGTTPPTGSQYAARKTIYSQDRGGKWVAAVGASSDDEGWVRCVRASEVLQSNTVTAFTVHNLRHDDGKSTAVTDMKSGEYRILDRGEWGAETCDRLVNRALYSIHHVLDTPIPTAPAGATRNCRTCRRIRQLQRRERDRLRLIRHLRFQDFRRKHFNAKHVSGCYILQD